MKRVLFFLLTLTCTIVGVGQDSLVIPQTLISNFEISRNQQGITITEEQTDVIKVKNLRVSYVTLRAQADTLSTALLFDIRGADGKIHLLPYRIVSYLDADEIKPFVSFLKTVLEKEKQRPFAKQTALYFSSRGGVYGICYMKDNVWKAGVSTDFNNREALTDLSKKKLKELIFILENYMQ